MTVKTQQKTKK